MVKHLPTWRVKKSVLREPRVGTLPHGHSRKTVEKTLLLHLLFFLVPLFWSPPLGGIIRKINFHPSQSQVEPERKRFGPRSFQRQGVETGSPHPHFENRAAHCVSVPSAAALEDFSFSVFLFLIIPPMSGPPTGIVSPPQITSLRHPLAVRAATQPSSGGQKV